MAFGTIGAVKLTRQFISQCLAVNFGEIETKHRDMLALVTGVNQVTCTAIQVVDHGYFRSFKEVSKRVFFGKRCLVARKHGEVGTIHEVATFNHIPVSHALREAFMHAHRERDYPWLEVENNLISHLFTGLRSLEECALALVCLSQPG